MVSLADKNDYLKKYLSGDADKKKKKSKKKHGSGLVIESDTAFAIVAPASSSKCAFDDESGSDDSDREIKILNPKKTGGFITDTFQSVDIVTTIKEEDTGSSNKQIKQERPDSDDEYNKKDSASSSKEVQRNGSQDASPPRKSRRHESPDASPPRKSRRHESPDASPPRKSRRHESPDASPPRKSRRHRSPDASPPRRNRRHRSPDASPPRRNRHQRSHERHTDHHSSRRTDLSNEDKPRTSHASRSDSNKVKQERDVSPQPRRRRHDSGSPSPQHKRHKSKEPSPDQNQPRRKRLTREQEARNARESRKQVELDKKYAAISGGVAQQEERQQKIKEMEQTVQESFTRNIDDESMNKHMKEQLLGEDDPMNEYISKKNIKIKMKSEFVYPVYTRHFPQNRYGIPPGYRWDGVDRSNGFESKMSLRENRQKAEESAAYRAVAELAE